MSIRPATAVRPPNVAEETVASFDVWRIREDFPILEERVHGHPLVYLDNANTTQKPRAVLETLQNYYTQDNANIHRSTHLLSERATQGYEGARAKVQRFINAARSSEIVFTRNATESINLVASSYGRRHVQAGDEIVISTMEHHSNIVPWQLLCEEKGAVLRVIPINDAGELLLEEYEKLLNGRTRFVSIVEMSNSLGTINPVHKIIELAHQRGVPVLVDGAQAVYHRKVDVQALDCEFYAFSGHKTYGPTGIGVLYGKAGLLEEMPPYQGGGDMIRSVTFAKTTYNSLPHKFEAGTPNIAGGIGLGAAIDYLETLGMDRIAAHEQEVLTYGVEALSEIEGLRLIGTAKKKASILSFVLEGIHPHDIGTVLDLEGIAIRTGQHCTQPVMDRYSLPATARASLALYNTKEEIDALVRGIYRVQEVLG
jgi:cysteine desulfurase / selenocysteine lyase